MSPTVLADPAPWAMTLGVVGRVLIWVALAGFVGAAVTGFAKQIRAQRVAFLAGAIGITGAIASLATLTWTNQFQYQYVWQHTMKDLEPQYRIAAVWAGQEGSFLLWAFMSLVTVAWARRHAGEQERLFIAVAALVLAGLSGILAFESPFRLIEPLNGAIKMPPDGRGLSPALLNYWMVIHPPTIFFGFGSLLVPFALATAALIRSDRADWLRVARPWSLVGLGVLGLGLCMGGFWAYEMLNWGGFWMWDPVENTSFVPWVLMAAFVHAAFVPIARQKWHFTALLLAALPFLSFCYGTFLTRSGFLGDTSVHSFAQMDRSALYILVGLGTSAILGFLGLWGWRMFQSRNQTPIESKAIETFPLNRASGYGTAIWLLIAFGAITAVGMSVPLIMSLRGEQPKMVEEQLYHFVLGWFFPPFMLAMALFPLVTWRGLKLRDLLIKVNQMLAVSIFLTGILLLGLTRVWVPFPVERTVGMPWGGDAPAIPFVLALTWLCIFALVTNISAAIKLWNRARPSMGGLVTHIGFSLTLIGLIFSRGFEQKVDTIIHPNIPGEALGYRFDYIDAPYKFMDRHNKVKVQISGNGENYLAHPGLYFTPPADAEAEPDPVVWPYIRRHPLFDLIVIVYPMDFMASNPTTFARGDLRAHETVTLKYIDYRSNGEIGPGAEFVATFEYQGLDGEPRTVQPRLKLLTGGQSEPTLARLDDTYSLRLDAVMAESGDAVATLFYNQPAFPLQVFYKPLTILVWLGVGVMTLGALWAASYRLRSEGPTSSARDRVEESVTRESIVQEKETDEAQPTAQV